MEAYFFDSAAFLRTAADHGVSPPESGTEHVPQALVEWYIKETCIKREELCIVLELRDIYANRRWLSPSFTFQGSQGKFMSD